METHTLYTILQEIVSALCVHGEVKLILSSIKVVAYLGGMNFQQHRLGTQPKGVDNHD